MAYFPKIKGTTLHLKAPKKTLKAKRYTLMIKDLAGRLLIKKEDVSLPNSISLKGLIPGQYIMTLISSSWYYATILTTQ
jgi:hypothetical protein